MIVVWPGDAKGAVQKALYVGMQANVLNEFLKTVEALVSDLKELLK